MVSEVNGPPVNLVANIDKSATKVQPSNQVDAAHKPAPASGESVTITDLASRLDELTKSVESLPVKDQQKIDELRSSIQSGNYQVDAEVVAEKLNAIEQLLGAAASKG